MRRNNATAIRFDLSAAGIIVTATSELSGTFVLPPRGIARYGRKVRITSAHTWSTTRRL
jgi:ribosomal protein L14